MEKAVEYMSAEYQSTAGQSGHKGPKSGKGGFYVQLSFYYYIYNKIFFSFCFYYHLPSNKLSKNPASTRTFGLRLTYEVLGSGSGQRPPPSHNGGGKGPPPTLGGDGNVEDGVKPRSEVGELIKSHEGKGKKIGTLYEHADLVSPL